VRWVVPVVLVTFPVGCANTYRRDVAARATFDLHCAIDEEDVVNLDPLHYEGRQYGVNGCDCRATYVNTSSGWILNNVSGTACRATSGGELR
jgi:hypothetical protein